MLFVAPLRHEEDGIFQLPFHLERHDNLFRSRVETLSDFRYGGNQKFLVALLQLALILVGEALVDSAVFYVNIVDEGILHGVIIHDGEDINVGNGMAYHLAFCLKFVQQLVLLLVFFGYFEAQKFGIFHHQIIEIFAHFAGVSLQNFTCLAHVFLVLLVALLVDTRGTTVVNMVLQTGLVFAFRHAFFGDRKPASAGFIQLLDDLQNGIHAAHMRVRTEESSHLFIDVSGLENAGKILVRNAYRRVGFAVFQQNIIPWIILFYEAVFQQKGIFFGVYNGIRDVENLRNKHLCLVSIHLFMEVRRHSSLQVFRLSHVYNRMVFVVVLIASWLLRHAQNYVFQPCQSLLIFLFRHLVMG